MNMCSLTHTECVILYSGLKKNETCVILHRWEYAPRLQGQSDTEYLIVWEGEKK